MLHDLTRIAGHKRLRTIKCYALEGEKFGVMRKNGHVIRVSPSVHNLLETDYDAVAKVLKVHILDKHERLRDFGEIPMNDFCPNCDSRSIKKGFCYRCGRDYRVGFMVERRKHPRPGSYALPTIRETLPNWLPMALRDKTKERGCGIRLKK